LVIKEKAVRVKKITKVVKRPRVALPPKLVLVAHRTGGLGLRALANNLSEKVGYYVYRVTPNRVGSRVAGGPFMAGFDKIHQLTRFRDAGVSCPPFVVRAADVGSIDTKRIVARKLVNASEGRGIVVFEKGETPPPAPLYVGYIVKKKEFRVHVFNNEVIDVAEKRKRRGYEQERDSFVRNTANGYVFCRTAIIEPTDLRPLALSAVQALGRSYGAVDIIWNEKQNKCFVLEVNSRPGMEGTTVEKYSNAILASAKGYRL
jgi:hypothetical protein